jgi:hypothetical protein
MTPSTNEIKEIHPGVFWTLLEHPTSALFGQLLDPTAPYVLCWSHHVGDFSWQQFALPIVDPTVPEQVLARVANFAFCCSTEQFMRILPALSPSIRAVQLRSLPPNHLDLDRIQGKERWRLLADCGWHVLLDTPGNDFGEVASTSRHVVENAVALMQDKAKG